MILKANNQEERILLYPFDREHEMVNQEVKLRVFNEAAIPVDISLPALSQPGLYFSSLKSVECAFQSV